ncbi:hypothetical protein Salat_2954600 [Sesamum alatum]|uniref:C2H2-type domain-containing protein n=1 Tax=Sesamum alatum TaxID=300844 RepID=A0AAE2C8L0_9LAMI|nr:hypothetical protein Salat_2954600 [Sesamum alatum]
MARKRKGVCPLEDDPRICVDRNDIVKLTRLVRSWEFTCSFCFKKFPSAQAMGGHQNAHRSERLEEKRLFVRDPIGYRKRAYLKSMKANRHNSTINIEVPPNPACALNLHAATIMVKHELANINVGPPRILKNPVPVGGTCAKFNDGNNSFSNPTTSKDSPVVNNGENLKNLPCAAAAAMNFLPPKELSLAESVGRVHAEDAKGKACMEFNIGAYEINLHQKLDLTLKL